MIRAIPQQLPQNDTARAYFRSNLTLHAHTHTQQVDDLLCLGDSCSSNKLSHGVIAIIGVSTALVASLILLFAYQRRGKTTAKKAAPAVDSQV